MLNEFTLVLFLLLVIVASHFYLWAARNVSPWAWVGIGAILFVLVMFFKLHSDEDV